MLLAVLAMLWPVEISLASGRANARGAICVSNAAAMANASALGGAA